jgi:hypothetical protein
MRTTDLEVLKRDFYAAFPVLEPLILGILEQEISRFPVVVATRSTLGLGLPVQGLESLELRWLFRISLLEEMVQKKVIEREKLDAFRASFDDPHHKACVLVVTEQDANFISIPFPEADPA